MDDGTELHFGPFAIDARASRLLCAGNALHITPKALQVLRHIAQAAGALVTRDELFAAQWPEQIVTDDALTRCIREIRAVLEDDSRQPRYISTVHTRGYRFVAVVVAVIAPSTAADLLPTSPTSIKQKPATNSSFVGRSTELERGVSALATAVTERRGVILAISGEAGIGKSRLAAEYAEHATAFGALVLIAQAVPPLGAPPLWLWLQLLRGLPDAPDSDSLVLGDWLPEWHPSAALNTSDDSASMRFALHDALARKLGAAARRQTLLMVLEDLHESDADTLAALTHLGRAAASLPLAIVATWRDVGTTPNAALLDCLAELARSNCTYVSLPLRGFAREEVGELAHRQGHGDAAPDLKQATRLHTLTGGNPLFLRELLALPVMSQENGEPRYWPLEQAATVTLVLQRRLRNLAPATRAVLELAALVGTEFGHCVLLRCASVNALALEQALHTAVTERLVSPADDGDHWRFTHDLLREELAGGMHAARRQLLHGQIARAFEQARAVGLQPVASAVLARHFLNASPDQENLERAAHYLEQAADAAYGANAFHAAAAHYEQLLATFTPEVHGDKPPWHRLAMVKVRAAYSLAFAGVPERALALAEAALEDARAAENAEAMRLAVIAVCELHPAYPIEERLFALLDDALAATTETDDRGRAELLARRAYQRLLSGDVVAHRLDAELALTLARRAGDEAVLERALSCWCFALNQPGRFEQWRTTCDERVRRGARRSDRFAIFDARRQLLELAMQSGAAADVDYELALLGDAMERLGTTAARAAVLRAQAGVALVRGKLETSWQLAEQAYEVGRHSQDSATASAFALLQFGGLLGLRGDPAAVMPRIEGVGGALPHNSLLMVALIHVQGQMGMLDIARGSLERLSDRQFSTLPQDVTLPTAFCNLSMSVERLQHHNAAAQLYPRLLPYAGRNITVICYYSSGCASSYLGRLATVLGRWDDARAHFEMALEVEQRSGVVVWRAGTAAAYARACRAQGGANLLAQAELLDAQALALAQRHGFVVPP